jgi:hypothetical protein
VRIVYCSDERLAEQTSHLSRSERIEQVYTHVYIYIVLRLKRKDDILDLAARISFSRLSFVLPLMPPVNRTVRSQTKLKSIEGLIIKLRSTAILMPRIPQKSGSRLDVIVKHELAFL